VQKYTNTAESQYIAPKGLEPISIMIVCTTVATLQQHLQQQQITRSKTGFVPTMGALHQGHLALIEQSLSLELFTICSIFVNPTQFNNPDDFAQYPITIANDIRLLEAAGCHVLFLPSVQEMYPQGTQPTRYYELGFLETVFEGSYRPGHFQGVCQVVHRLLQIVPCGKMLLGQKDYQQCMVLTQLVKTIPIATDIIIAPTVREADGLAMSSRNMRLNPEQRQQATAIYKAMQFIKSNLQAGDTTTLASNASQQLLDAGFTSIDYVSLAHAHTLEPITDWDGSTPLVVLVAAFLGEVRLIDNYVI